MESSGIPRSRENCLNSSTSSSRSSGLLPKEIKKYFTANGSPSDRNASFPAGIYLGAWLDVIQLATMQSERKKDLKEQIHELQKIIHLQEQGRNLFTQGSQEAVCKNRDLIGFLRSTLREGMHELNLGLRSDWVTIHRACREKKLVKIALAAYTVEQAREALRNRVFDRMNAHNVLLYEVKRRGKHLEELQARLQGLMELETANPEVQIQLQIIRQLENSIEKVRMRILTAQKTHILYVKMLDVLRDDLSRLPYILDDLERRVDIYTMELKGMDLMATDMQEVMEAAKADMINTENELIAEKKFRENTLSIQKKQIERIRLKEATERHRRMQARRDMDFPPLMGREGMKGSKLEASKAQIEYQSIVISEVEKVKFAVQCSHLWDIAGRFMAQKKSEENLQQQIAESEKKRRDLKAQLKGLELERAELKFHQSPSSLSSKKLEGELEKALGQEEERLWQVQEQVSKNQELLLHFENGVDNLIMRLCDIHIPGQEEFPKTDDIFEKLQFCETRLLHLNQINTSLLTYDFSQEESNERFVHIRNFLEESTRDEQRNLRITFDEDEEDVRGAFTFGDIDHSYVPNREEIKKQGLKLIEEKTKVVKKKQRSTSKK